MNILEEIVGLNLAKFKEDTVCINWLFDMLRIDGLSCYSCGNNQLSIHCTGKGYVSGKCYKCMSYTHPLAHTMFKGTQLAMHKWFIAIQKYAKKEDFSIDLQISVPMYHKVIRLLKKAFIANTIYVVPEKTNYFINKDFEVKVKKEDKELLNFKRRCELNNYTPSQLEIDYVKFLARASERL